jgi:apolipoprotein N-acyltransferase
MPPVTDLNDRVVYRIAVGAIGLALIVVLAGLCVIVALGIEEKNIPQGLWTTASALGGGLLGLLAPQPTPSAAKDVAAVTGNGPGRWVRLKKRLWRALTIVVKDIWANRTVAILFAVFAASVAVGAAEKSSQLQALAGASGAALVGLLAPAPGASDGGKKS